MNNKCEYCGGPLVVEFAGEYGEVYKIKKSGLVSSRRIRKIEYETDPDNYMIYCYRCREVPSKIFDIVNEVCFFKGEDNE